MESPKPYDPDTGWEKIAWLDPSSLLLLLTYWLQEKSRQLLTMEEINLEDLFSDDDDDDDE